jgi:cephalosporin hydroxylase
MAAKKMMMRFAAAVVLCAVTSGCSQRTAAADSAVSEIEFGQSDTPRMLRGFYPSQGAWRWTAPSFAVSLDVPKTKEKVFVVLEFTVPSELAGSGRTATLTTKVNGVKIGEDTYGTIGSAGLAHEVPNELMRTSPVEVEFSLNRDATAGPKGERRGVIVVSAGLRDETRTPAFRERIWKAGREEYRRIYSTQQRGLTIHQDAQLKRLFHDSHIWDNLQFLGVPILKNPLDLWMVQRLIYEVRPDYIIETGTFRGGSSLYWAHVLEGLGLRDSRILSIDIGDYCQAAAAQRLWRKYVEFFHSSSTDEDLIEKIAARVKGKRVMVMLDSNHEAAHVLAELKAYAPMVSRGGYIIVEDTHMDGVPTQPGFGPGPFAAAVEFLRQGGEREFERDRIPEGFGTSFNPGGWLRRK